MKRIIQTNISTALRGCFGGEGLADRVPPPPEERRGERASEEGLGNKFVRGKTYFQSINNTTSKPNLDNFFLKVKVAK